MASTTLLRLPRLARPGHGRRDGCSHRNRRCRPAQRSTFGHCRCHSPCARDATDDRCQHCHSRRFEARLPGPGCFWDHQFVDRDTRRYRSDRVGTPNALPLFWNFSPNEHGRMVHVFSVALEIQFASKRPEFVVEPEVARSAFRQQPSLELVDPNVRFAAKADISVRTKG